MANIIYKALFSVQLLHEYYLITSDGSSMFEGNIDKSAFLLDSCNKGIISISSNFLYEVPAAFKSIFESYHLHIVPNYAGFVVMSRVLEEKLADGTVAYKPFIKLPDNLNIPIQLSVKNNLLNAVTDMRVNRALPAAYYFTNEDIITAKILPSLSVAIAAFDAQYAYEQGELYVNDENKTCLFYLAGNRKSFLPVKGNSYANTRDELVVPLQFTYTFSKADTVTSASFQLKNSSGKTVRKYLFANPDPIKNVTINFSFNQVTNPNGPVDALLTLPGFSVTEENIYTLKVTVNNKKVYTHQLIFYEDANATAPYWAIVSIRPMVANTDFNVYDAAGLIKYRKHADGVEELAPVFEIRIKSRSTFWRYINDKNGRLKVDANDPFLEKAGNNLVTKIPRPASYLTTLFKEPGNQPLHYLPNPESNERVTIEGEKIYTNIRVPESKMFPLDTS
jgi:hypothetical protein